LSVARLVVAAMLALRSSTALAIDGVRWPSTTDVSRNDPLASLRWPVGGWTCLLSRDTVMTPRTAQTALNLLDRRVVDRPRDARAHAARAVILRLLERTEEAARALDRAVELDRAVLDDPDVGLTQAFLQARAGHYEQAVQSARRVLPRLSGPLDARVEASIEVARWSLLRGPEGVGPALAILREAAAVQPPDPMLRTTLSFALVLAGRQSEAREVARSGPVTAVGSTVPRPLRGTLAPDIVDAAAGVAVSLSDHAWDASAVLERVSGAQGIPASIRPALQSALQVSRATPRRSPAPPPPPQPRIRRLFEVIDE
jgi:tetratricopeptide (TPR) repeat protein